MSLKFTAGDLTIHRLIEEETTFLPVHARRKFCAMTPSAPQPSRKSSPIISLRPASTSSR
jgi:hypothetical protein